MISEHAANLIAHVVLYAPAALALALGAAATLSVPITEKQTARMVQLAVLTGLTASVVVLFWMLTSGSRQVVVELGDWAALGGHEHFHFHMKFVFDRLSVPFSILSFVLVGVIGAFAQRYLHRERGYQRFFLLYAFFLFGIEAAALAGTIETLFLGWELVGLSSALLVAFFQARPEPVENGQRVWAIYRFADAAFLIAAVVLHHSTGAGDFSQLMGEGSWPQGRAALAPTDALLVGGLLLVAAAGKSALLPFSGWLPRAMEGPTPSSAVFYGALSVHLGAYLLLRIGPLLSASPTLSATVVVLGAATAVYAALVARVQSDVKTALAMASLTQVGIITAEIGLGLRYLPLAHMIGHASFRTLQLLRSPSLLQDYHSIEHAVGLRFGDREPNPWIKLPEGLGRWLYRYSLRRGSLDAMLDRWIVMPIGVALRWSDRNEQRWLRFLEGDAGDFEAAPPQTPRGPA